MYITESKKTHLGRPERKIYFTFIIRLAVGSHEPEESPIFRPLKQYLYVRTNGQIRPFAET